MRNPLRSRKQGKSKGEAGYGDGRATIDFGDDVLLDEEAMSRRCFPALKLLTIARRPSPQLRPIC